MITPSGFSRMRHAGDEVVEVGHLGQHVVADDEVGLLALRDELPSASSRAEELDRASARPCSIATLATLAAGSMPSTGTPSGKKVLQQVAVVAGELDDEAVRAEAEALRDHLAIGLGVRDP